MTIHNFKFLNADPAIYLVERLILATTKVWFGNVNRVFIGLVISILGRSTVKLLTAVLFTGWACGQSVLRTDATDAGPRASPARVHHPQHLSACGMGTVLYSSAFL